MSKITDKLKLRIRRGSIFELIEKSVKLGVPPVELMQDTFTDILEGENNIKYLKMYIGGEISRVMKAHGYTIKEKNMPVRTRGIFGTGSSYKKN